MSEPFQIARAQTSEFRTLFGLAVPVATAQLGFMTMGVIDTMMVARIGVAELAAVAIAQVFIAPPLFSETGNYVENTAEVETAYLESFGSQIGRQTWVAGLLIGFTLLGLIAAARSARSKDQAQRRNAVILLLSFVSISLGIVLLAHLAWQRYYLPLIPFTTIFSALGFVWGIKTSREIIAHGRLSDRLSQILAQFAPDSRVS